MTNKSYAVFTTHFKFERFETYEAAWRFAQKVYQHTGNVVAIEKINQVK
jgi:hypothetical protein